MQEACIKKLRKVRAETSNRLVLPKENEEKGGESKRVKVMTATVKTILLTLL